MRAPAKVQAALFLTFCAAALEVDMPGDFLAALQPEFYKAEGAQAVEVKEDGSLLQVKTQNNIQRQEEAQPIEYCSGEDTELAGQAFDYIVIGAGTAGSTAAGRLAQAGKSVLLFERGPDDTWQGHDGRGVIDPQIPNNWMRMMGQKELDPGPGATQQAAGRAEMVGGCSMHNLMVWLRGHKAIWDLWGDDQWAYDCIESRYKLIEDSTAVPDQDAGHHGSSGPVKISPSKNYMNINNFFPWAKSRNFTWNDDLNGASQVGVGHYVQNTNNWRRWSLSKAFLTPEVRAMKNFKLLVKTAVTKITFSGTTATGVEYERTVTQGMKTCRLKGTASVGKEIILCGGAYRSPQLLMLSGVGPAETLKKFGIKQVLALEGVGQHLEDHPRMAIFSDLFPALQKAFKQNHTNPLTDPGSSLVGHGAVFESEWCKKNPTVKICQSHGDLQFMVMDTGDVFGLIANQLSTGYVTLSSTDPYEQVAVYNNWLTDEAGGDLARAEELWRIGLDMAGKDSKGLPVPQFLPVGDYFVFEGYGMGGKAGLKSKNATLSGLISAKKVMPVYSMWHPSGTCKMGPATDKMAVVDYELKVQGLKGLRVADASIMPIISNTNPNAPCAVIGWSVADFILGRKC